MIAHFTLARRAGPRVLWAARIAFCVLVLVGPTSCDRDTATVPQHVPNGGFGVGLWLPPDGAWDGQVQAALQDSSQVWLYLLGADPPSRFSERPHPDNPARPPYARASAGLSGDIVLEIDPLDQATWWRVFVRRGGLLGQTTFTLAPEDREHIANLMLAPETAVEDGLVVYAGLPVAQGGSPPDASGSLDAGVTLLFPVAVENPTAIDGLSFAYALDLSVESTVYVDPGSRLCAGGDSLAYVFFVTPLDAQGGCRRFSLSLRRAEGPGLVAPVAAGADVLFYIAAAGDTAGASLCLDRTSVRFKVGAEEDTVPAHRVVGPAECEYPVCEAAISSPMSGEVLCAGAAATITWTTNACCGSTVGIALLHDRVVCRTIAATTANDGEHVWTVTGCGEAQSDYQIALLDASQAIIAATTGGFSIEPGCRIAVTAPAGGERYTEGESRILQWQPGGCCGDEVRLELLSEGEPCLTIAATTENDGMFSWTVAPCSEMYSAYRLRVTDLETQAIGESGQNFSIFPACAPIVDYPNGGETFCVGQPETLTWMGFGCQGPMRVELLRDGESCLTIAEDAPNTGSYEWTPVPCEQGAGEYSLRIADQQTGAADTSAAPFTIAPACSLGVTSPTAGQGFCPGDPVTITWTVATCCGPSVGIELLHNGVSCLTIVDSTPNNGSYAWIAEPCEGTTGAAPAYSIRVTDPETEATGTSPGLFTIGTCEPAITGPAPGAELCLGSTVEVTWTAAECCGELVRVELLCDGLACGVIADSTANDGSLLWTVGEPGSAGVNFGLRVTDLESGNSGTVAPFGIAPSCAIVVTGPTVQDEVCEGAPIEVTWTASSCCASQVSIELLLLGDPCLTIAASTENNGLYLWTPERCDGATEGYTIRVAEIGGQIAGETPAAFTIGPPCAIAITSPTPQATLCEGDQLDITWSASACCGDLTRIELLLNGTVCETIATVLQGSSYAWTVAACGSPTDNHGVRVTNVSTGQSDEVTGLTIHPACALDLTYPDGGETLCAGETVEILWTYGACCGRTVAIDLLRDGISCRSIATAAANTGHYAWTVGGCGTATQGYQVRVRDLSTMTEATSAVTFSVEAECAITITSPGYGDEYCAGDLVDIEWLASSCCPDTFTVEQLCDGAVCATIAVGVTGSSYAWEASIPPGSLGSYTIRVRGGDYAGESDVFTVSDECIVYINYPNGEEELCEGDPITITWGHELCCGSSVGIALLREGVVVDVIASSTANDGSHPWTPERFNSSSVGYQIQITDLQTGVVDLSDAMFRINPECYIDANAPNGGMYYPEEPVTIAWDYSPCCEGPVRIELLLESEPCAPPLVIAASTPNDGLYTWPAVPCGSEPFPYTVLITHLGTGVSSTTREPFWITLED